MHPFQVWTFLASLCAFTLSVLAVYGGHMPAVCLTWMRSDRNRYRSQIRHQTYWYLVATAACISMVELAAAYRLPAQALLMVATTAMWLRAVYLSQNHGWQSREDRSHV